MTVWEKSFEAKEDFDKEHPSMRDDLLLLEVLFRRKAVTEEEFEKLIIRMYADIGRVPRWYKGVLPFVFGVDVTDMDVGKIEIGVND